MNLSILISYASAAIASLFVFVALFSKRRGSIPLWAFAIGMLALAGEQLLSALAQQSQNPIETADLIRWRFAATALLPGLWLMFASTYSRGDVLANVKKRLPVVLLAFLIPLSVVSFAPDHLARLASVPDRPFRWIIELDWAGFLLQVLLLLSMIGALVGLERTYRASVGTLRWKIKFMLYGMGVLFAARFFTSSQIILAQQIDPSLETINAAALLIGSLLVGRSVLRKGSFDIDLYPSQSIISGSVVITLAGAYLIVVGVLSKIVSHLGGDQGFVIQILLVLAALVGLGLLIQSDRMRQLVRRFVSRNFQRPLYDYRTLWLKVTEATSQSVRRKEICQSTTRLLAGLFDTKLTSIWLFDTANSCFVLAASSDQATSRQLSRERASIEGNDVSRELLSHPDPIDLESLRESWTEPVKRSNPSSFPKGGNRVLVPLIGRETVVGFIILGDRTNTLEFTQQEFDTLRCIADHIASSLLNAELTKQLEQSREIEAFQTMATFFVHDLKNAVSTLNLMLKNMPKHWDNPEFREDALRGLGRTSTRISDLITRLGEVRNELEIHSETCDLGALISETVESWQCPEHVTFSSDIQKDIRAKVDREKLKSVVLNLIINGAEAISESGRIELELTRQKDWAVICVRDTGSGMSEEFLRNSLFRPFKTTKQNGLGIGMFQSKMIVKAHGGSISVESTEGEGSVFTIRLPVVAG
ncbi:XrtA/PEP-CTERM system histidine kinase PrsK [Pelagicoccus sp. SDUM812003]|uniref:XrtA/PEP-CTERM system histidine kinase PrsK n=1 Tax=Pelagicoccus sp. SDUM812003 TaxID=3041267 RepID=UPI00280F7A94|nr:XrtA/PEP-CTERM system histidine kinase PrsK [Pelagicoccus sp. SDUM812003]MDQ8205200.1 PEP-CTERM system histidine kinase PrsK [Pelagicoccus sp. SDUM812003]